MTPPPQLGPGEKEGLNSGPPTQQCPPRPPPYRKKLKEQRASWPESPVFWPCTRRVLSMEGELSLPRGANLGEGGTSQPRELLQAPGCGVQLSTSGPEMRPWAVGTARILASKPCQGLPVMPTRQRGGPSCLSAIFMIHFSFPEARKIATEILNAATRNASISVLALLLEV